MSTTVGPLGSGLGGGVELTLHNIAEEMQRRGHQIHIVAPTGSVDAALTIIEIAGELQITAQTQSRHDPITMPANAVLANMWEYARQIQERYDILVNFAYDWLPFYLTPFFQRPIAHLVSMGSLSDAMDQIIQQVADQFPGTIGVHSQAQANTFPFAQQCRCLENGLDLSLYHFEANPDHRLAWVGRIAPEKGLEDAIAAVQKAQIPLSIWGTIQDEAYWNTLQRTYPDAPIRYEGFLPTAQLQQALGKCQGLLMTPKWVEAFGNVAIEALACGVPVIAYHRGGPAEIVQQGKTGWLVEPDQIDGLVDAIAYLDKIDRHACRQQAETRYSMSAMGDRVEAWLSGVLGVG
ncbi:MAG TPA: glycosyltransferase family 4 protein [Crinalium sp.]